MGIKCKCVLVAGLMAVGFVGMLSQPAFAAPINSATFTVCANGGAPPCSNLEITGGWTLNPSPGNYHVRTIYCPNGSQCGYGYANTGIVQYSWHGYTGGDPATYINNNVFKSSTFNTHMQISMPGGDGLNSCSPPPTSGFYQPCGTFPYDYLAPTIDNGNFLWTAAQPCTGVWCTATAIQISPVTGAGACSAGSLNYCFNTFAMFWGSVDYWNTVQFTDVGGNTYTINGNTLASTGLGVGHGNNINSAVVTFQATDDEGDIIPLRAVTFKACGPDPNSTYECAPSFEFDNLAWSKCGTGCTWPPPPGIGGKGYFAPAPEPASWLLIAGGISTLAGFIKRKQTRPDRADG